MSSELAYTTETDQVIAYRHLPPGGRHLMVAVDLSENSFEAVRFAFDSIAREKDVVSVVQAIAPIDGAYHKEKPGEQRQDAMISLYEKVKVIRAELGKQNIPFRVDVDWGDPRQTILELIEKHAVHILIVGSRGRSAIKGIFLGSVSQYLLTHAKIPVVVVRTPKAAKSPTSPRLSPQ